MATFNYELGRKKDDGRYPIYLKIRNGKTNTMRSLDISVAKSEWNVKSQRISVRKTDDYDTRSEKDMNNDFLDELMDRAKEVERMAKKRGVLHEMSATNLMDALLDYSPAKKEVEGEGDFVQYWHGVMMETPKSQEKYKYALKAVLSYQMSINGIDRIFFRDITADWVRNCLAYIKRISILRDMEQKLGINHYLHGRSIPICHA